MLEKNDLKFVLASRAAISRYVANLSHPISLSLSPQCVFFLLTFFQISSLLPQGDSLSFFYFSSESDFARWWIFVLRRPGPSFAFFFSSSSSRCEIVSSSLAYKRLDICHACVCIRVRFGEKV